MTEPQRRQQSAEEIIQAACPPLAALGVATVSVSYDGSYDSGIVARPVAVNGSGEPVEIPEPLENSLQQAVQLLLPGCWELDQGSAGRFLLDVAQRTFVHQPVRERPDPTDDILAAWQLTWDERNAERKQQARDSLTAAWDDLTLLGVAKVHIEYDGYGDSGAVEDITARNAADEPVPLDTGLEKILEQAAERLLPWGWENETGAWGAFVLDVPQRTITRQHHWRIEATEYEEETHPL